MARCVGKNLAELVVVLIILLKLDANADHILRAGLVLTYVAIRIAVEDVRRAATATLANANSYQRQTMQILRQHLIRPSASEEHERLEAELLELEDIVHKRIHEATDEGRSRSKVERIFLIIEGVAALVVLLLA